MSEKYPKDVRIVIKNYPLPMHQYASKAAMAALAAGSQGKFWEYHRKLVENFSSLSDAKLQDIAQELKLDTKKFSEDLASEKSRGIINRDMSEGNKAGVRGTPTIFVNGKLLENRSVEGIARMIEDEKENTTKTKSP